MLKAARDTKQTRYNLNFALNNKKKKHESVISRIDTTYSSHINFNQIVIFNIGEANTRDSLVVPPPSSPTASGAYDSYHKLRFENDKINYCNFDPEFIGNKRHNSQQQQEDVEQQKQKKQELLVSRLVSVTYEDTQKLPELNIDIFLKGQVFNETSQITG